MTGATLLVGTAKGLFRLRAAGGKWRLDGPSLPGHEILHACALRDGRTWLVSARHAIWGAHVYRSVDGGEHWESMPAVPKPATDDAHPLKAVWCLAPGANPGELYAGIDPAALFLSRDDGLNWSAVEALNAHPTRNTWEPARGGFSLHSIQVATGGDLLYAAISAGGVYRSEDAGRTWQPANDGIPAPNLPQDRPSTGHNVHRLVMHPSNPQRLYRQCYVGTWRSDDGGRTWQDITGGLPGNFGYAIACDPAHADTVFQVPEESSEMRCVAGARLRVYRSDDAGRHWRDASAGLPQAPAYVTVLREAMDVTAGEPCSVYFGTSGGHVFGSADGGESWRLLAEYLPRVLSVRAMPPA